MKIFRLAALASMASLAMGIRHKNYIKPKDKTEPLFSLLPDFDIYLPHNFTIVPVGGVTHDDHADPVGVGWVSRSVCISNWCGRPSLADPRNGTTCIDKSWRCVVGNNDVAGVVAALEKSLDCTHYHCFQDYRSAIGEAVKFLKAPGSETPSDDMAQGAPDGGL